MKAPHWMSVPIIHNICSQGNVFEYERCHRFLDKNQHTQSFAISTFTRVKKMCLDYQIMYSWKSQLCTIVSACILQYHGAPLLLVDILSYMNMTFTLCFTIECTLKLVAYGPGVNGVKFEWRALFIMRDICFFPSM